MMCGTDCIVLIVSLVMLNCCIFLEEDTCFSFALVVVVLASALF